LIDGYRGRWEIERFFNILKNGCQVEALQMSTLSRIEPAPTLYRMAECRIGYLMRGWAGLARRWSAKRYSTVKNGKPRPDTPPPLNEVIRVVASFGGFPGRKGDGEPGAKTLRIGLQRVMDFALGIRALRETGSCV